MGCGRDSGWLSLYSMKEKTALSRQLRMVEKGCKLHSIQQSSLCSILSEMALLLSSFRANMCTPKGKTHQMKTEDSP